MTTKEIILAGGTVSFSYKEDPKEWVGTASIRGSSGGCGLKPCIRVEIPTPDIARGGSREFDFKDIDEAISVFESIVFRPKNLMYKMAESMIDLYNLGEEELDLDNKEDLAKVRKLQKEKQKNEKK